MTAITQTELDAIRAAATEALSGECADCIYNTAQSSLCNTCCDGGESNHFKGDPDASPTTIIAMCDRIKAQDELNDSLITDKFTKHGNGYGFVATDAKGDKVWVNSVSIAVEQVEAENIEICSMMDTVKESTFEILAEKRIAESANTLLREALEKYGRHRGSCKTNFIDPNGTGDFYSKCSCGLKEALKPKQKPETKKGKEL